VRPGEEHLIELRPAGELFDRPDLDALLVDGHEEEGEAMVALRAGLAAGEDEQPLAEVGVGRPHLLPVEHPLVTGQPGPGLHVGQIGAGTGFGVPLCPELLDRQDLG